MADSPQEVVEPTAVTFWSPEKVMATIQHLEEMFGGLKTDAQTEIAKRESEDEGFLSQFCNQLMLLSVAKRAPHVHFFHHVRNEIVAAQNTDAVLPILYTYTDYRNYKILLHLITEFCTAPLQESMQKYRASLEAFEIHTTVDVYSSAVPDEELERGFSQMVLKIDKPASQCSLHEVRKLNEVIITTSGLESHSVYIGSVAKNCVMVSVRFPSSAVGWVLSAMTPNFMTTHCLSEVTLDGQQLSLLRREREKLNEELISASKGGDVVRVASLLNSGAHINTVGGPWSQTPLVLAIESGHLRVVRLLTARRANLESRDKTGWTPLIYAAVSAKCDVVSDLLVEGTDVDAQNNDGESAMIEAASGGHTEVVVELVKANAKLDLQDKNGQSALMRAAKMGYTEVVEELVKARANFDLQDGRTEQSALFFSAERGDVATTQALLKAGANAQLRDKDGLTALDVAHKKDKQSQEKQRHHNEQSEYYSSDSSDEDEDCDYEAVIGLLSAHTEMASTSSTHCDTLTPEDDTTYTEQDRTQNIPCTDTTANDQILSTPGGRREVPTAFRNLINSSKQIIEFIKEGNRLKHKFAYKKEQLEHIIKQVKKPETSHKSGDTGDAIIGRSQPLTEKEMTSYQFDQKRYPGIRFFGSPWTQQVTSDGAHIREWGEEIGIEFDIPPGAVPQGKNLDLSVWPCSTGPFQLPEGYELASPVFLISPSFQFSREVTLKMNHFCALETKEDCEDMAFLSSPASPSVGRDKKPVYKFRVLSKAIFEPFKKCGTMALKHFCASGVGRKRKASGSNVPSARRQKGGKSYAYQVYRKRVSEDLAVFSASLNHPMYFQKLKRNIHEVFRDADLYPTSVEPISIEGDGVLLKWPSKTLWTITPDKIPCKIFKEALDDPTLYLYPPIIKLDIEQQSSSHSRLGPIEVKVVGITEKRKFVLNPKPKPSSDTRGEPPLAVDCRGPRLVTLCNELADLTVGQTKALVLQLCGRHFDMDYVPVEDRKLKLLEKWLTSDSNATWSKLVNALKAPALELHALAEIIRTKHCPLHQI